MPLKLEFDLQLQSLRISVHRFGFLFAIQMSLWAQMGTTLTIVDAVREALDQNLDLIATRFEVPIARAQVITASLRPNPVFSLAGDHLNVIPPKNTLENAAGPPEYAARTDFVFERGGKRQLRVEVARAAQTVAELLVMDAVRQLTFGVQSAFVEVLQAKADLGLARESLETFDEIVRINQRRVEAGDLAEVELIRSQVAQLQFETAIRQAELRVQTAVANLELLLGRRKTGVPLEATGELRRDGLTPSAEEMREKAFARRPDYLAQQRDRARSLAEVRLQLAQAKVDYVVGSEYRRQQGIAGRGNSIGLFFEAGLPVFNRNQGEIERARQQQMQTEARLRAIEAAVENDVEIARLRYLNSLRTLENIEASLVGKARDVREITEYSYRRGEANFLEFLDAQRAYIETMQTYNAARADLAQSLYGLDAATAADIESEKRP